jgi:hypothetical protein
MSVHEGIGYQCDEGDFESMSLRGAMTHAELTGHSLTQQRANGESITVSLVTGDDLGHWEDEEPELEENTDGTD